MEVELSAYKGKVLLIVNTATGCVLRPTFCADQLAKVVRNTYNTVNTRRILNK